MSRLVKNSYMDTLISKDIKINNYKYTKENLEKLRQFYYLQQQEIKWTKGLKQEKIDCNDFSKLLNYYLNNNATTNSWWGLSPGRFDGVDLGGDMFSFNVYGSGSVSIYGVVYLNDNALRPAVTLLSSTQITGGNGTISNPYTIAD